MNQLFLVVAIIGIALAIVAVGSPLFTANANVAGGSVNARVAAPVAVTETRLPNPVAVSASGPKLETLVGRTASMSVTAWMEQVTLPASVPTAAKLETLAPAKNKVSVSSWIASITPSTNPDLRTGLGLPVTNKTTVNSFFSGLS